MTRHLPDLKRTCADLASYCDFIFADVRGLPLRANLADCLAVQLGPLDRKTHRSAARELALTHDELEGMRQRLNRTYLSQRWHDDDLDQRLDQIARLAVPEPVAWLIDDTGVLKKGEHSPGVHRQYTGTTGKTCNCQVFVSLHQASFQAACPMRTALFLPKAWADDAQRCERAGIPVDARRAVPKTQLALELLDELLQTNASSLPVLADEGYGKSAPWRAALRARGLEYMVCAPARVLAWEASEDFGVPAPGEAGGRPPTRARRPDVEPRALQEWAEELERREAFEWVELSRGRHTTTKGRAAAMRVRTAGHLARPTQEAEPEQWLVVEWAQGDAKPSHYWLSNLGGEVSLEELVELARLRWRIERDYQDLKQEVGLDEYEGRRWVGLNHHLRLCRAAFLYLACRRQVSPPQAARIACVSETTSACGTA